MKEMLPILAEPTLAPPDARGRFGAYGGRFVPETLMSPLIELERAFRAAWRDARLARIGAAHPAFSAPGEASTASRMPCADASMRAAASKAPQNPRKGPNENGKKRRS